MAPRISLALAIHNHQPVGNFDWVLAEVYDQAYRPMLDALERHPGVRLSLHYTGPLLEWLRRERPEFIERLRGLVAHGRVELLGGGYYEPVLASLPERDRIGQLSRMADEVERLCAIRPRGAWLAERVWEPDLPTSLAAAGYRWTILDDAHFRAAAIPEEALWGAYTTEDQGNLLTVFGTEQGLRYRIPFGEVDDVIAYLRGHATEDGKRVGMMGDDGEKFGAWPTTWEHCWGKRRWIDRFFEAIEANRDWLTMVTPSEWLEREPPIGRVYLPTGSYAEMGEWSLPADEGLAYANLLHDAVERKRPEARWLRGGFWRNFQVKYREINDLHKQMLRTSGKVAAMPDGPQKALALDHLYQGQSNDCYWHGLFGGIYINHMRLATFEHLIAAEDSADGWARTEGGTSDGVALRDIDLDGIDEALLSSPGQIVTVKLNEGAGIGGWDIRAVRHALTAVMRRRPEAYHSKLLAHEARLAADRAASVADRRADAGPLGLPGASGTTGDAAAGGLDAGHPADSAVDTGPISIHDLVTMKEPGLARKLKYDWYERRSGLVHLLDPATTRETFAEARYQEWGDFVDRPFGVVELAPNRLVTVRDGAMWLPDGPRPIRVEKRLILEGDRREPRLTIEVSAENRSHDRVRAILGVEWNLMMLGGGGNPAAFYEVNGVRHTHDSWGSAQAATISSGNEAVGITVTTQAAPSARAWWFPIETISNSESGFERVYQGSCLLLGWPLELAPGERLEVRISQQVTTTLERATGDTAAATEEARAALLGAGAAAASRSVPAEESR